MPVEEFCRPLAGYYPDLRTVREGLWDAPTFAADEELAQSAAFLADQWETRLAVQGVDLDCRSRDIWWEFSLPQDILDQLDVLLRRLLAGCDGEQAGALIGVRSALAELVRGGQEAVAADDRERAGAWTVIVEIDRFRAGVPSSSNLEFFTGQRDVVLDEALGACLAADAARTLRDGLDPLLVGPVPVTARRVFADQSVTVKVRVSVVAAYDGDQEKILGERASRDGVVISDAREALLGQFMSRHNHTEFRMVDLGSGPYLVADPAGRVEALTVALRDRGEPRVQIPGAFTVRDVFHAGWKHGLITREEYLHARAARSAEWALTAV